MPASPRPLSLRLLTAPFLGASLALGALATTPPAFANDASPQTTPLSVQGTPAANPDTKSGARGVMVTDDHLHGAHEQSDIPTDTVSLYRASGITPPKWLQRQRPALERVARRQSQQHGTAVEGSTGHDDQDINASETHQGSITPNGQDFRPGTMGQELPLYCDNSGTSGKRVQAMYIRESDQQDRYAEVKPILINELRHANDGFYASGARDGSIRQIRFVTTGSASSCEIDLLNVVVDPGDMDSWSSGLQAMAERGYDSIDRKYVMLVDHADAVCGLGTRYKDDRLSPNNNEGSGYARIDPGCWTRGAQGHSVILHEITHTLGAVNESAPNSNGQGHCTDDWDRLCYVESQDPNTAPDETDKVCGPIHEDLLDCNGDDYFNTNPSPGSYLDTHWNTADSPYLHANPTPVGAPITINSTAPNPTHAGTRFTLTAQHSDTNGATYRWTANQPGCIESGQNTRTVTIDCVSGYGPVQFIVDVRKANGTVRFANIEIDIADTADTFADIEGPDQATADTPFDLRLIAVEGTPPYTYQWDLIDTRCTRTEGTLTSQQITVVCDETAIGDIARFGGTVTGAGNSSGYMSHGVAITDGSSGGGGGNNPVLALIGESTGTSGQKTRLTTWSDKTTYGWAYTDDQDACYTNGNDDWVDVECFDYFSGTVTIYAEAVDNQGRTGTTTAQVTMTPTDATTVTIEGPTNPTSGTQVTYRITHDPDLGTLSNHQWTLTDNTCLRGATDTATLTLTCDAHQDLTTDIYVTATTSTGETVTGATEATFDKPANATVEFTGGDTITAGAQRTLTMALVHNGTPLRAATTLEASTDQGATWSTVLPYTSRTGRTRETVTIGQTTWFRYTVQGFGASTSIFTVTDNPEEPEEPEEPENPEEPEEPENPEQPVTKRVEVQIKKFASVRNRLHARAQVRTEDGDRVTGNRVLIQRKVNRSWRTIARARTNDKGFISKKFTKRSGLYRLRSTPADGLRADNSSKVRVRTNQIQYRAQPPL